MQPKSRTVPSPRPGELLIYDCRPPPTWGASGAQESMATATTAAATASEVVDDDGHVDGSLLLSAGEASSSSPPTPTPARQVPTFTSGQIADSTENHASAPTIGEQRIRCLQWNIERNYKPDEILTTLTELNADILCIQEIDIGCRRSGHDRDHFLEICASQGLYGGFVPEFWELEDPARKDRDQGGGVHGNAILSRWPINGFRVLDHVHHAYEWERDGHKLNEPRLGRRFTIVADIQTPSGPLLCYCAHLEVFTGIVGRISALSDILADAELYSEKYPYQIIFGDLNTISHSIARLAKAISTDQYRVMSVGSHEAEWWDQNLWSWHVQDGEFNIALATGGWSWLRRIGVLGLGTGKHSSTDSAFWAADTRYSTWLKKLVEAGLDKVKKARQEQIAGDVFVNLENQHHYHPIGRLNKSSLSALESSLTQREEKDQEASVVATTGSSSGGRASTLSENSFQEMVDGSMILVDRSRSPSVITLDSSLLDRGDYSYIRSVNSTSTSSPTWSLPSTSSFMQYEHSGNESDGEDGEELPAEGRNHAEHSGDNADRHLRPNEHHRIRVASGEDGDAHRRNLREISSRGISSFPSTPSTPSPTLRLIPPTPKRRRSRILGEKTDFIGDGIEEGIEEEEESEDDQEEDRRGIVLQYDDDENDRSLAEKQRQWALEDEDDSALVREQQKQRIYTHQQNPYDHHTVHQHTHNNDGTTLRTFNDHHNDLHDHDLMIMPTADTVTISPRRPLDVHHDTFQEPQPPFLLSHFQSVADAGTQLQKEEAASLEFFASRRLWSGFTPLVLHQARNPGFYDPWDSGKDLTLHNPAFLGLLSAKLDYTLLKNLRCESRAMGNHDYSASDHKWLLVEVIFERDFLTTSTTAATTKDESESEEGKAEEKKEEKKEWAIPSKEQQYLWWRERRQQWGQPVQPLSPDRLQQQECAKGKSNGRHRKRQSPSSSSSSTASIVMATLTAVAAVGGYLWWTRGGK
ncbi:hypothetical protein EMPS_06405 [Entomortierella parvispora]|uniref:Endonuclease/exonuclease/phosphatase domain-containing protein n=1 Tax=Entomortierella parvispora TaxID=205924 RepID=A0A9P3LXF1_9FUNG|nr:hypothetical protein EMPS_06405 [Entomortierella parvispora]